MTLLHELFNTRNIQGFQRLLDASIDRRVSAAASSSSSPTGPKSWTRSGGFTSMDVNTRDRLGRTALHLASSSLESIEYVRALLKHPNIDLNLMDSESHWTALHRALYSANLPAALLLLQRPDIDTSLKDLEGYTAFDLYNSTVPDTKPDARDLKAELFTWGANRNAALGHGDGDDRTYPDRVVIKVKDDPKKSLQARFSPIFVTQIQMSKLHTALVTSENEGNLRLCGFGSGGRLGPAQYTQYSLQPLSSFPQPIAILALGQDHTLVLTKSGEVFSWGLNRFSQLGYVVEVSTTSIGRHEEPIQSIPKRVVGLLRREVVVGVSASKNASACWTKETVFTWGTNTGQLGYDKAAQPVQVSPRPVTKFSNTVIDIAMTDTVLAGLLISRHVECIWNDTRHRINFPMHAFPSGIQPYRPPQSVKDSHISKITSCDETIAALSSNGEVFTFSAPPTSSHTDNGLVEAQNRNTKTSTFKPQRVWALRKKFSSVKDVAIGSEGSIIICTESGHVFVRTRNAVISNSANNNSSSKLGGSGTAASGKTSKFERVPFLQRVTRVCANSTGAYGALRVDWEPKAVDVVGNGIEMDLKGVQPYLEFYRGEVGAKVDADTEMPGTKMKTRRQSLNEDQFLSSPVFLHDDDKEDDATVQDDISGILKLCRILKCEQHMRKAGGGSVQYHGEDGKPVPLPNGADTMVYVQPYGVVLPVHRFVLAARSDVFNLLFCGLNAEQKEKMKAGEKGVGSREKGKGKEYGPSHGVNLRLLPPKPGPGNGVTKLTRFSIGGCHPLTVVILFWYFYSDELLAIWDQRVGGAEHVRKHLVGLEISPARVKRELQALSVVLHLPSLSAALEPPAKRAPLPSMRRDMSKVFEFVQPKEGETQGVSAAMPLPFSFISSPLAPDVVLELADKDVYCHSVVLRARSPFFASFFGLEDWTIKRWNADGTIRVNMRHLKWHTMQFVLRFMCCGDDIEMFHTLDFVNSVDELIGFMFEVLACANELLLDRLVLLCSSVILANANIYNACYILSDATHYHAQQLVERLQEYITVNMESFLESRMLDEIAYTLVKQLAKFVRAKQTEKSPFSRSDAFVNEMMEKHAEWLAEQDLPEPIVRANAMLISSARVGAGSSLLKKASFMDKISPSMLGRMKPPVSMSPSTQPTVGQPITTPQQPLRRPPLGDDVFVMDEMDTAHSFGADLASLPSSSSAPTMLMSVPALSTPPAWKASGNTRVDMKAVMAEAAIQSKAAGALLDPHTPRSSGPRTPQSDQRRYTPVTATPSSPTPNNTKIASKPAGVTLPWRSSPDPAAIRAAPLLSSTSTTPSLSSVTSPTKANPRPSGISASRPQPSSTQLPGMGPVITPTRQLPSKSGSSSIRSASGGKVWTHPTPEPTVSPTLPASVMSFVAIQYSQQEQLASPAKDKRSLREIQEEEQALEAEADFLKWWTAEEERVQEEALALAQFQSKVNKQPRKSRQHREKGQRKSTNVTEPVLGKHANV
ncbi:hypothetical protein BYT27DRAFT_7186506 [Phlegmacium glaucopus]|nr:hypothetical protein BYT27DRAFT_7186506 [Phlegmacium glaucopus]